MGAQPTPRRSAFEQLLGRVYLEIWEDCNTNRAEFAKRVKRFVDTFLPSIFQEKILEKIPDFEEKLAKMEASIEALKRLQSESDSLTAEQIDQRNIPEERAELAEEVWHAVVDVLTDAGFNFPMAPRAAGMPHEERR